jgi:hypothetical protein
MTSRAPCETCDNVLGEFPEDADWYPHVEALHREIEELRALVRDCFESLMCAKDVPTYFKEKGVWMNKLADRAKSALAKPHAGKGP